MNGLTYLAFSAEHPLDEALKKFETRFGRSPREIVYDDPKTPGVRLLRLGPLENPPPFPIPWDGKGRERVRQANMVMAEDDLQLTLSFDEE